MARSAAIQYLEFINKNHPTTRPYRGVGFHGITLGMGTDRRADQEVCYFSVNKRGSVVNIPVSVAPLIRVFRPLVFRQVFPWRQVFQ
jgi:hypothetical protein